MNTDEIGSVLEELFPASLAESWDNVGWQLRVPGRSVTGVLLTLDVSSAVLEEAQSCECNLVIAHHPLLFRPVSSLDLGAPPGSLVAQAVRNGISIWAAHTNLDVMPEGTSFALARALGLASPRLLSRVDRKEYKLVVYVPPDHADAVKNAMAEAGAGRIGNYTHCFWQVLGTGQFRPEQGASPYLGTVGQEERVDEFRVEGVVPQSRLGVVLDAMRRAHPYEEVAFDLLPLANPVNPVGFGAVGELISPSSTARISRLAARKLRSAVCQVAGDPERIHRRVAVMGGSGASLIEDAARSGATLFITADVRYHDAEAAVAKGLDLVILDHYATELPVLDTVRAWLEKRLGGIPIRIGAVATSPFSSARV